MGGFVVTLLAGFWREGWPRKVRLIIEERWIVEEGRGLEDCGARGEWAWGKGLGKVRSDGSA